MDDDAEVGLQSAMDGDSRDAVWTALAALETQVARLRAIVAAACIARNELVPDQPVAEEAEPLLDNGQATTSPPAESSMPASDLVLKKLRRRLYGWATRAARLKP